MYGLSGLTLTYDAYVQLQLNKRLAQARKAQAHLIALRIQSGQLGPTEFYALDQEDPKAGQTAYEIALLRAALRRPR